MKYIRRLLKRRTEQAAAEFDPVSRFQSDHYVRHNARRLEHLASLGIPVAGSRVLEIGAGIGDHTHYYLDRGCEVVATDARPENLSILRSRYPSCRVEELNVDSGDVWLGGERFDVVHCYGLLYHVREPQAVLRRAADANSNLLFLETCVSFGREEAVNSVSEPAEDPTQAFGGLGCRPTRPWIFSRLRELYEHVYMPRTQPNHFEFPVDWGRPNDHSAAFQRAIFVASRRPLLNPALSDALLDVQSRHA